MLTTILLIALAVDRAAQIILAVVAPKTKTTLDDKFLEYAQNVEKLLDGLGANTPATVTDAVTNVTKTN